MLATKLTIAGLERFLAELEALAPDFTAAAGAIQRDIATETADAIRAGYPSDTGALRASVQTSRRSPTAPARVFTMVTVTAPYVEFVEFGTARTAPHPVFVPLMRLGRERVAREIIQLVEARGLTVRGLVA